MAVTRESLLGLKLRRTTVPAPELGKDAVILVQQPNGTTSERLDAADYPPGEDGRYLLQREGRLARWAIACVVNEDGTPMFTEADTPTLNGLPASLLDRIFAAARNPLTVEEAAKNS